MPKQIIFSLTLAASLLATSIVKAERASYEYAALASVSAMEQRIGELENRLTSYEHNVNASWQSETGCIDSQCGCGGFIIGAEAAFLQYGQSGGGAGSYSYEASPRFWLGYQRDDGLGVRVRMFHYENDQTAPPAGFISDVQITTIDFEIYDTFFLGDYCEVVLAGGLRYSEYQEAFDTPPVAIDNFNNGYGPIIGIRLTRSVCSWLSVFGLARESIIMTDERSVPVADLTYNVTELQIGLEVTRPTASGAYFFARGAFEAQAWNDVSDAGLETATLMGGNFAIGFAR
ncbi:MAG: hypothetical protein N2C12_07705 [Planctomycetales bacterium]